MKKCALGLVFLSASVMAEDTTIIKYGIGVADSGKESLAETKYLGVGQQLPLFSDFLVTQWEVGAFADNAGHSRKSSAFAFYGLGVHVNAGSVYAQSVFNLGLISTPDAYLGGPFQASEDMGVGLQSKSGASMGLHYKHISSAGIERPNNGRDFLLIQLKVPL